MRRALLLAGLSIAIAGCGAGAPPPKQRRGGGIPPSLLAGMRPIGHGPRFQPGLGGRVPGACMAPLGRRLQAHVEVFAANRVLLLATGIGTRPPRRLSDGRLTRARCFGDVVTLDPTGTVYLRRGRRPTLGDLFSAWGQSLGARRIASFGGRVRVYVNGVRWPLGPRSVPLGDDAEVVLEIGPQVPPHTHFRFPTPPSADLP